MACYRECMDYLRIINHKSGVVTHDSSQIKGYGTISSINQVLGDSNDREWIIEE